MSTSKFITIGAAFLVLGGCQSFKIQDLEDLPASAALPAASQPGVVQANYFHEMYTSGLASITQDPRYPDNPSNVVELNELRQASDYGDKYGTLVRGYIVPKTTGEYRFYVAGNDLTDFYLSTSVSPDDSRRVASSPGRTGPSNFSKYSSQSSELIRLEANKRYYFYILHKEWTQSDDFVVEWEGPGVPRSVVGSEYIASYAGPENPAMAMGSDAEAVYRLGYRSGYFDGKQGVIATATFPPLDADGDQMYDNWEVFYGLNPKDPSDAKSDADDDLLTALDEFALGTNPNRADSDGDGLPDGYEFAYALQPLDKSDALLDQDGDGFSALEEFIADTDPSDAAQMPVAASVPGDTGSSTGTTGGDVAADFVTVYWEAPSVRTDGTGLSTGEIDHYTVRYGTEPGSLDQQIEVPGTETEYAFNDLTSGLWYFTVQVVDTAGLASAPATVVEHQVP